MEENTEHILSNHYGEKRNISSHLAFSLNRVRKLSVMFILLSATGWLILISHGINLDGHDEIYIVSTLYVGPFLFTAGLLYAAGYLERLGVITYSLSMLYVMFMGAGLISYGEVLRCLHVHVRQYCSRMHTDYRTILGGGIISLISWTCVLILCQFYYVCPAGVQGGVQGNGVDQGESYSY